MVVSVLFLRFLCEQQENAQVLMVIGSLGGIFPTFPIFGK